MTTYTLLEKNILSVSKKIHYKPEKIIDFTNQYSDTKIDFSWGNYFENYKCPLCGDPAIVSCNCGHYLDKHGHTFTSDGKEAYEKHPITKSKPINHLSYIGSALETQTPFNTHIK